MSDITLCHIDELIEGSSKGFTLENQTDNQPVFLIRKDNNVYGYINSCPHTGAPLEWMPDQFLSRDGEHLQCALHGARFEITSGLCISGPCFNESLTAIPIEVIDQQIIWKK